MSEVKIGEVVLLQVHGDLLKRRDGFDPAPLIEVEEASLDAGGMLGWTGSAWVVDVHHQAWPGTGSRRPLSIGFTSHYDKMRRQFRDIPLGTAGENIIVACDQVMSLESLGQRIVIRGRDGRQAALVGPRVAKPCLQFTSFMLELPNVAAFDQIAAELALLDDGTRGFIVGVDELADPVRIHVGDEVFVDL